MYHNSSNNEANKTEILGNLGESDGRLRGIHGNPGNLPGNLGQSWESTRNPRWIPSNGNIVHILQTAICLCDYHNKYIYQGKGCYAINKGHRPKQQ